MKVEGSGLTPEEEEQVRLLKAKSRQCPGCGQPKSPGASLCRSCSTTRKFDDRYLAWRQSVLKGDQFTCQACGRQDDTGKTLRAHHIENYRRQAHLRYIVENGITLCVDCHSSFHNRYGTWGNNAHQVREFLRDNDWRARIGPRVSSSGGLEHTGPPQHPKESR